MLFASAVVVVFLRDNREKYGSDSRAIRQVEGNFTTCISNHILFSLHVYFLGSHAVLTQLCVNFCILPQRPQYQVAEVY